jgi:hypothetical protein
MMQTYWLQTKLSKSGSRKFHELEAAMTRQHSVSGL